MLYIRCFLEKLLEALNNQDEQMVHFLLAEVGENEMRIFNNVIDGTLLHYAIGLNSKEVLKKMLSYKSVRESSVNVRDKGGKTALYLAITMSKDESIVKQLILVSSIEHLREYRFLGCSYMDLMRTYSPDSSLLDILSARLNQT